MPSGAPAQPIPGLHLPPSWRPWFPQSTGRGAWTSGVWRGKYLELRNLGEREKTHGDTQMETDGKIQGT